MMTKAGRPLREAFNQVVAFCRVALNGVELEQTAKAELMSGLRVCADRFRMYELIHRAKRTEEGDHKAERNAQMVQMCESLIAKHTPPDTTREASHD